MIPLRRSRRGNYSILMASAVVAIMGFAALAVDISLITMAKLQAQATADAASHAALVAYRSEATGDAGLAKAAATRAATFMVRRNAVAMAPGDLDAIDFGVYDRKDKSFVEGVSTAGTINAIQVKVTRTEKNAVDLLLAPMFGVAKHDVESRAITAQQERAMMIVQDWSGSMNFGEDFPARSTWPGDPPGRSSTT